MLIPLPLAEIMEHKGRKLYSQTITRHELDYIHRKHKPHATWCMAQPVVN